MIATKREPYVIQRKVWPERYARGWHVLTKADQLGGGNPARYRRRVTRSCWTGDRSELQLIAICD